MNQHQAIRSALLAGCRGRPCQIVSQFRGCLRCSYHRRPVNSRLHTTNVCANGKMQEPSTRSARVAIVGDVHGAWMPDRDAAALRHLQPDLVLFVGDFGNEAVELVRNIASLDMPKAVILGNHDAWYSMVPRRSSHPAARRDVQQTLSAADLLSMALRGEGRTPQGDGVEQQLAALGKEHIGYSSLAVPGGAGYSVLGARPFSKGGRAFTSIKDFMQRLYGVTSLEESAQRIVQAASGIPEGEALIVMGHNGPAGLGSRPWDPCGVDWEQNPKEPDHGDMDLRDALAQLQAQGRRVALVAFGHMHNVLHRTRGARLRRMVALDPDTGTVYLNAASVPRIVAAPQPPAAGPSGAAQQPRRRRSRSASPTRQAADRASVASAAAGEGPAGPTLHHFAVVELRDGQVEEARDVFVEVSPLLLVAGAGEVEDGAEDAPDGGAAQGGGGGADCRCVAAAAASDATGAVGHDDGPSCSGSSGNGSAAAAREGCGSFAVRVAREQQLLRTVHGERGVVKCVWNAYDQRFETHVCSQAVPEAVPVAAAASG